MCERTVHASSTLLRLVVAPGARCSRAAGGSFSSLNRKPGTVIRASEVLKKSSITVVRSNLGSSQLTVTGYGPNTPAHIAHANPLRAFPRACVTAYRRCITRSRTRPAVVGRQQLGSSKGQGLAGGSYDPAWSRGLVLAAAGTLRAYVPQSLF